MRVDSTGVRLAVAAVTGAALAIITGCGGGHRSGVGGDEKKAAAAAQVVISPADGSAGIRPDTPVTVRALSGRLDDVTLRDGGRSIPGDFNQDHTEWKSRWALAPGSKIDVRVLARNAEGRAVSTASGFSTEKAPHTVDVTPDAILESRRGDTYGVGLPIIVNFDQPVTDRAAVERALRVAAEKPVVGAWHWFGDKQVVYRPKIYWPAHQKITFTAHLTGVHIGKDLYGTKDLTRTYQIGAAQIAHLDLKGHEMRVDWDGVHKRTIPISAGMGTTREYTTTSGIHLNMEKNASVWMTSPGRGPGDAGYYHELIHYAVRVSGAGEYLHQTPGDEGCLGRRNCSHGCIRQPAADAIWYYKHSQPGDPVEATGSDRQVEPDNGWSFFQMPWRKWLQGSALPH